MWLVDCVADFLMNWTNMDLQEIGQGKSALQKLTQSITC